MKNAVIVDTSVFIDFFRGKKVPAFKELLLNNQIFLSSYVRLELVQGVRKEEVQKLEYVLGGLTPLSYDEKIFEESEQLLHKIKGLGLSLGIVDLLITAEARLINAPIYSFDRIFRKLAEQKLLHFFEPSST